jgi:flagellar biosynthetic protein FliP
MITYLFRKHFILFAIVVILTIAFAEPTVAQTVKLELGDSKTPIFTSKIIQVIGVITILSLAPSILIMVTSFTRIIIVLSFLRTALGLQQSPPNSVLISLSLFLTFFIMAPTFEKSYNEGLKPLINNEMEEPEAIPKIIEPVSKFMLEHTREKDLSLFLDISKTSVENKDELPIHIIIPSFMLSELKRAFEIGFLIFLPFLIIDMLVASTLMAMGMMMIPPVMISLPFKLIFFVLIDGWYMLCGSLIKSYGIG